LGAVGARSDGTASLGRAEGAIYPASPPYNLTQIQRVATPLGPSHTVPPPCGGPGQTCCRPFFGPPPDPALGPIVSCQTGFGCDVTINRCTSPCGSPGQPCCDGPDTRATKWTADGRLYSPTGPFLREMCEGGVCDKQSHRCISIACGTQDGPCCPPDATRGSAWCRDLSNYCEYDPQGHESGTCLACGGQGRLPCSWGCNPGTVLIDGRCAPCGAQGQPPCDLGCNPGMVLINGVCTACPPGEIPIGGRCCPQNNVCGGVCCDHPCCGGGNTPYFPSCCSRDQQCCGGRCYPNSWTCCGDHACPSDNCCDGGCCSSDESCIWGHCVWSPL
jgi:hypothetical protein